VTPARGRAVLWSSAVLALTSLHHVYGAIRYDTPWRYHAVQLAAVTLLVMLGADRVGRARSDATMGRIAERVLWSVSWLVPILLIGGFEGLYNHVVKDALYFAGLPDPWMTTLFPPPAYEMPNDLAFETTGILQVLPAALAARELARGRPG
jgi:hypothetical protein